MLTPEEEIAELRRRAEQCRAQAMDAPTPEMRKRLERQAQDLERAADDKEDRRNDD